MKGVGRKIEAFEDRTRSRPLLAIVLAGCLVYVLIGVTAATSGAAAAEAWLYPLPAIAVPGALMLLSTRRDR
ncbi:hypothetical protein [Streptomyces paromomycinus]|uniref:Uncharacterized protein n=1 Tax=Streptomyces paromomycinus TaxID=92743 RepID=A0A401VYR5_STREY|nr:hypothetical protein [Streptomyces paromomycinus]GCD42207.1 hypothetical protein GKJPGBOP_01865 [Streptomyces paromomycinus]